MRIAVPIKEDRGLESTVHGHFGSAPIFARVDSETMEFKAFQNRNLEHAHGMCNLGINHRNGVSGAEAVFPRTPDHIVVV